MSRSWMIGGLVAGVAIGLGSGVAIERWAAARRGPPVTTAGVFRDVVSAIRQNFVDSLSDDEFYAKAARGVVRTLGDQYSSLLAPTEFRAYRDILRGRGQSLGFTVSDGVSGVRVGTVYRGSPAERAGLTSGQFLLEVDGRSTMGVSAGRIESWLSGDSGSVAVRLRRPGDSSVTLASLERSETRLPAVPIAMTLDHGIAYVALRVVAENASRQLAQALEQIGASRLQGLILDLRGNPGGRLDEGIAIAELFLDPGQMVGSLEKRNAEPSHYIATKPQLYPNLRLTVLVDGRTASSAEIVAAALKDNGRARVIGARTLGKGLVQTTIQLGDSVALRLSTGRWETPSGAAIQGGLRPDSVIDVPSDRIRIVRALAERSDAVARELESMARARWVKRSVDPVALSDADFRSLASSLKQAGLTISVADLKAHAAVLEIELRRLAAFIEGDAVAAGRLGLLSDPTIAVGASILGPTR